MRAADIIATRLYQAGCRFAFGIPGGEVLTIIDALETAGIRFILTKHENAGAFMAEGTYHASGAPAILVGTIGPGIANAVNGIANASQEHIPLIVISGCVDPAEQLTYTHQVFDHAAVLGPLCKATFQAVAGACDVMIDKAIAIATDARRGPVHIDLPIAVALSEHARPARIMRRPLASAGPKADHDLAQAQQLFSQAKKPVLLVGADALVQPDAAEAITAFARRHRVPVITSYRGKGVFDEGDELSLGGHGLSPRSDKVILGVLAESDLVILAGYDPIEMRAGWKDPWESGRAIEFVAEANTHYMHQAAFSWVCSIAAGLAGLTDVPRASPAWSDGSFAAARRQLDDQFGRQEAWGPSNALLTIRAACPADTVLTLDSGAHRILASQMWRCSEPNTLLQSTGLCTMGCALPLALGYKLAKPERPVVALMGDACLDMTIGELASLRDLQVPVVVIVFVDGSLSLIEMKQRSSGFENRAVDFQKSDYAAIARAYGGRGVSVASEGELNDALKAALGANIFSLIAVQIPQRAYDGLI